MEDITQPMLVQIVPPLRQSSELVMSCPRFYSEAIKGNRSPSGLDSARGTQIHEVMADYSAWCARRGVAADLEAFDRFAKGVGPVAARILSGMRESYSVDFAHLLATELTLALDEHFHPTNIPDAIGGVIDDSGLPASYQGTLDAILTFEDEARIHIDDAKSHPRPFDPADTLQAKMYALLAFQHFPWAQEVRFRLIFVRYKNLYRDVTFTRHDDVIHLMDAVRSARARQLKLHDDHDNGVEMEAIAGSQCNYCPLLTNAQCPIAQFNPHIQYSPVERLNFQLWYGAFNRANNAALKAHIDATGKPVVLRDFNGKAYIYGPQETEAEVYPLFQFSADGMVMRRKAIPLLPIVDLLYDYAHDNPGDSEWMKHLTISSTSLKRYLKTSKRAFLDQAIEDGSDKVTKISMRVSKPLDAIPEEVDEDEWEEHEF